MTEPTPPPIEAPEPTLEWVQAESGNVVHPMVVESGGSAWGGKYVHGVGGSEEGTVTLSMSVPATGNYRIECRIKALDWNSDSMYVSIDGGPEIDWHWLEGPDPGWHQELVVAVGADAPHVFHLSQGAHQLRFRVREAEARLDAVRLVLAS